MTRALYFLGGLFAMTMILIASARIAAPTRLAPPAEPPAAASPALVSDALDDLAAWPVAAGR
jgi:hypothetical protein